MSKRLRWKSVPGSWADRIHGWGQRDSVESSGTSKQLGHGLRLFLSGGKTFFQAVLMHTRLHRGKVKYYSLLHLLPLSCLVSYFQDLDRWSDKTSNQITSPWTKTMVLLQPHSCGWLLRHKYEHRNCAHTEAQFSISLNSCPRYKTQPCRDSIKRNI